MRVFLDSLFEFLSVYVQTIVDFKKYKCLRTSHIMHQPSVNSYFGLTTVKMPVAPLIDVLDTVCASFKFGNM